MLLVSILVLLSRPPCVPRRRRRLEDDSSLLLVVVVVVVEVVIVVSFASRVLVLPIGVDGSFGSIWLDSKACARPVNEQPTHARRHVVCESRCRREDTTCIRPSILDHPSR